MTEAMPWQRGGGVAQQASTQCHLPSLTQLLDRNRCRQHNQCTHAGELSLEPLRPAQPSSLHTSNRQPIHPHMRVSSRSRGATAPCPSSGLHHPTSGSQPPPHPHMHASSRSRGAAAPCPRIESHWMKALRWSGDMRTSWVGGWGGREGGSGGTVSRGFPSWMEGSKGVSIAC